VSVVYNGTLRRLSERSAQIFMDIEVESGIFKLPFKFWLDLDMSDIENIDYQMMLELPPMLTQLMGTSFADKKYILFDYGYLLNETTAAVPNVLSMLSSDVMNNLTEKENQLNKALEAKLQELAPAETLADGGYKISLNNAQINELIIAGIEGYVSFMAESSEDLFGLSAEMTPEIAAEAKASMDEGIAAVKAELPKVYTVIRKIELFPEPGIVHEYQLNAGNFVTHEEGTVNFKFDLAQIANAIAAVYPEAGAQPTADLDFVFTAVIDYSADFKNINTAAPIAYPVPTDENSFDVYKEFEKERLASEARMAELRKKIYVEYNGEELDFPDAQPAIVNGRTMVSADVLITALGGTLEYVVTDGNQTVNCVLGSTAISMTADSNTATINGTSAAMDATPYMDESGRMMIPLRFIAENMGLSINYDTSFATYIELATKEYLAEEEARMAEIRAEIEKEINAMPEEAVEEPAAPAPEDVLAS
jgi:hypothetical protein